MPKTHASPERCIGAYWPRQLSDEVTCEVQERPGLVVLTIELEGALAQMPGSLSPSRMWSPYREPLAKFLNKYSVDVSFSAVNLLLANGVDFLYLSKRLE